MDNGGFAKRMPYSDQEGLQAQQKCLLTAERHFAPLEREKGSKGVRGVPARGFFVAVAWVNDQGI